MNDTYRLWNSFYCDSNTLEAVEEGKRMKYKPSKYHSKKTEVDGIIFDSRKEACRYQELRRLERAGAISDLQRQVKFELVPKHEIAGIKIRATHYIADFVYNENGQAVIEDVKGYRTPEYKRKKKQMKQRYGIDIKEV